MVQDAQDRGRVLPALDAIDQQQGLQPLELQARLLQERLTGAALNGGETENTALVVPEQKPHPAVAQQALPIKHHDQTGG